MLRAWKVPLRSSWSPTWSVQPAMDSTWHCAKPEVFAGSTFASVAEGAKQKVLVICATSNHTQIIWIYRSKQGLGNNLATHKAGLVKWNGNQYGPNMDQGCYEVLLNKQSWSSSEGNEPQRQMECLKYHGKNSFLDLLIFLSVAIRLSSPHKRKQRWQQKKS